MRVSVWITIHLCSKELVDVSRMVRKISRKNTWSVVDETKRHCDNLIQWAAPTFIFRQQFEDIFHLQHQTNKPAAETHCSCYTAFCTSICIFRWTLKWDSRVRKMASESSKTSGTEETPFLDRATHKYCLMALTNISWVRNTGPAPCSTDSSSCRETIFERNSWDLQRRWTVWALVTLHAVSANMKKTDREQESMSRKFRDRPHLQSICIANFNFLHPLEIVFFSWIVTYHVKC